MKITIIGAGNMGGAIARGLAQGTIFNEKDITVTARSGKTLQALQSANPGFIVSMDNAEAIKDADIVLLAVKPWLLESVIDQIRHTLNLKKQIILSVVAAVSFADLQKMLCGDETFSPVLFRIIPNTAVAVRQSMTIISAKNATIEQTNLIKSIFDELGESAVVEENLMGAATALCSCGIAFAYKYIQANINGAVELGLYPDQARKMITQTLRGAADLMDANDSMPEAEIYKVTTPGGITIKGLNEMDANGFSTAVVKALRVSTK